MGGGLRSRRRSLVALSLGTLSSVACASAPGAPASTFPAPITSPASVTSMPSTFGIQLRLPDATATVRDGWIYVVAPSGAIRTYQGTAPAWDLIVRAQLSTCTGRRKSAVVSESRAVRLAPLVGFTQDESLLDTVPRTFRDTLRADLGVPPHTDLTRSWITWELAWPIEGVLATYQLTSPVLLADPTRDVRDPQNLCR